ncbi:hypothetical protein A2U01_0012750, partial [Trifolium medium]|nr:hypothetical protein [Trifolium medium]
AMFCPQNSAIQPRGGNHVIDNDEGLDICVGSRFLKVCPKFVLPLHQRCLVVVLPLPNALYCRFHPLASERKMNSDECGMNFWEIMKKTTNIHAFMGKPRRGEFCYFLLIVSITFSGRASLLFPVSCNLCNLCVGDLPRVQLRGIHASKRKVLCRGRLSL